jgi:hypothetical protein
MKKRKTWDELMADLRQVALAAQIDEETIRRFNETFDSAERAKRENERRLRVRLAELRAAHHAAA